MALKTEIRVLALTVVGGVLVEWVKLMNWIPTDFNPFWSFINKVVGYSINVSAVSLVPFLLVFVWALWRVWRQPSMYEMLDFADKSAQSEVSSALGVPYEELLQKREAALQLQSKIAPNDRFTIIRPDNVTDDEVQVLWFLLAADESPLNMDELPTLIGKTRSETTLAIDRLRSKNFVRIRNAAEGTLVAFTRNGREWAHQNNVDKA